MRTRSHYSRRQVEAASRAARVFGSPNVRVRSTPFGRFLNFRRGAQQFDGAWMVTLVDEESATVLPGSINSVEATIKGVPLSEDPQPVLRFGSLRLDPEGRGYICAEVTCKPEEDWAVKAVEIVQVADPDTEDGAPGESGFHGSGAAAALSGNRARYPLAMIRRRSDGRVDVIQNAYFPLQHRVSLAADGKSAQRHFFY